VALVRFAVSAPAEGTTAVKTLSLLALYFGIALLGLILLSCGGDSEASAEEQLCQDLDELHAALRGVADPPEGGISRDSIEETRDEISSSFEAVEESALEVADVRTEDLRASWDALRDAIDSGLDSGESPQTVLANVSDAFGVFVDELTSIETNINCDDAGSQ
jgi:hypothetical protein